MFINIVFWLGSDKPLDLFFRALYASFHTHSSLLTLLCFLVLFTFCRSHAQVFWKTIVHEFISNSRSEWCLLISDSAATRAQCVLGAKK